MSTGRPSGKTADREGNRRPFSHNELETFFAALTDVAAIALAVSGGADSMALMVLVRRWLDLTARNTPKVKILTVDHRLRAEAAREAEWVAAQAARRGFEHCTLHWQGDKPATGIQAAAREARYELLCGYCRKHEINTLLVAHTSDDQAETLMMRLARGSGVDGLSAMAPVSQHSGVQLARPLLGTARARLENMLREEGQSWLEDPSNNNDAYERVATRQALGHLEGLGLRREALTRSAARLGRARRALEAITDQFLAAAVTLHAAGYVRLNTAEWSTTEEEIVLRALHRLTSALGGTTTAPDLAQIEAAYDKLQHGTKRFTVGGCLFFWRKGELHIAREYGRIAVSPNSLLSNDVTIWDERFRVTPGPGLNGFQIRPLGPEGYRAVKTAKGNFGDIPREAVLALPSLWRKEGLVYAPCILFEQNVPSYWLSQVEIISLVSERLLGNRPHIVD